MPASARPGTGSVRPDWRAASMNASMPSDPENLYPEIATFCAFVNPAGFVKAQKVVSCGPSEPENAIESGSGKVQAISAPSKSPGSPSASWMLPYEPPEQPALTV